MGHSTFENSKILCKDLMDLTVEFCQQHESLLKQRPPLYFISRFYRGVASIGLREGQTFTFFSASTIKSNISKLSSSSFDFLFVSRLHSIRAQISFIPHMNKLIAKARARMGLVIRNSEQFKDPYTRVYILADLRIN